MTRAPRDETQIPLLLERLVAAGTGAPPLDEKLRLLQEIRSYSREIGQRADRFLLQEVSFLQSGLGEARENQEKLRELLEQMTAPPLHPAVFLGLVPTNDGNEAAMITWGTSRRVVRISEDVDRASLLAGDEVLEPQPEAGRTLE